MCARCCHPMLKHAPYLLYRSSSTPTDTSESWCNRVCILMVSREEVRERVLTQVKNLIELMIPNLSIITHTHPQSDVALKYLTSASFLMPFSPLLSPPSYFQMHPFPHVCSRAVCSAFVQHSTALTGIMSLLRKSKAWVSCELRRERC